MFAYVQILTSDYLQQLMFLNNSESFTNHFFIHNSNRTKTTLIADLVYYIFVRIFPSPNYYSVKYCVVICSLSSLQLSISVGHGRHYNSLGQYISVQLRLPQQWHLLPELFWLIFNLVGTVLALSVILLVPCPYFAIFLGILLSMQIRSSLRAYLSCSCDHRTELLHHLQILT